MRAEPICLVLGLAVAAVCFAADGDLDSGFGDAGQVTVPRPDEGFGGIPTGDIALSTNDDYLWLAPLASGHLWVGRSHHDGTPDTAFGPDSNGRIELPTCVDSSAARLVATADGGAVIWTGACLLQVDMQGNLDPLFGGNIAGTAGFEAGAMVRDAAGRFLLCSRASTRPAPSCPTSACACSSLAAVRRSIRSANCGKVLSCSNMIASC